MNEISSEPIEFFPMQRKIAKHRSLIDRRISAVLDSGSFILGQNLKEFETSFAKYLSIKHCIGVGNDADAIEICLRALNLDQGSKVLTVANASSYSINAIAASGMKRGFMDIHPKTLNCNFKDFVNAYDENVKVVILTHLYGNPVEDTAKIVEYCKSKDVFVIEDCAQAHGAQLQGKMVGTYGDIAAFSFYPTKNLGGIGDAGLVATNEDMLALRSHKLRNYGWGDKYKVEIEGGRNTRLDEIQASILSGLLEHLDEENAIRKRIAVEIMTSVDNPLLTFLDYSNGSVFHLLVLLTDCRQALIKFLSMYKIQSAIQYPMVDYSFLTQPETDRLESTIAQDEKLLSIPIHPFLTKSEVIKLVAVLNNFRANSL